jgi:hypothetical protein
MGIRPKMTKAVKESFVAVLRETASPTQAAKECGVSTNIAYIARRRDMEFQVAWDEAVDLAYDQLLPEAYRRAMHGAETVVVQGGRVVSTVDPETGEEKPLTVRMPSDRLMEVMLRYRYPQQLANRVKLEVEGPLSLDREVLIRMPPQERAVLLGALQNYAAQFRAHEAEQQARIGHG